MAAKRLPRARVSTKTSEIRTAGKNANGVGIQGVGKLLALTLFPVVCCCVLLGPTAQYCQPLGADPRCALPKPVPICNVANPLGGNPSGVRGGSRHFGRASEETHQQKTKRRFPRKTERAKKTLKIRNVRIFRKMKCGRPNARQLQTCFPQKLKRTKTENTERPHFPNFQKTFAFSFSCSSETQTASPGAKGRWTRNATAPAEV